MGDKMEWISIALRRENFSVTGVCLSRSFVQSDENTPAKIPPIKEDDDGSEMFIILIWGILDPRAYWRTKNEYIPFFQFLE